MHQGKRNSRFSLSSNRRAEPRGPFRTGSLGVEAYAGGIVGLAPCVHGPGRASLPRMSSDGTLRGLGTPAPPSTKRPLIYWAVLLAASAAALIGGYVWGAHGTAQAEQRTAKAEGSLTRLSTACQTEKDELNRQVLLLDVHRQLTKALVALDERNFGIAQSSLAASAKQIRAVSSEGELGQLAGSLEAVRLVATEDLGPERSKILDLARRLDGLLNARR